MNRRLNRSSMDKKVAGVCGGLAEWLGISSTLVRVLWAVLTIFGHFFWGVAIYGILAVVLPLDSDVSEGGGYHMDTSKAPLYVGASLLALGGWMLLSRLIPDIARYATPVFLIVVGGVLVLGWQRKKEG